MSVMQVVYQTFIYQSNVISGHKNMVCFLRDPSAAVGLLKSLDEDIGSRNNFWVLLCQKTKAAVKLTFCPILEKMKDS